MGTLYIMIKSVIITVTIVTLMQFQFRDQTVEDRVMSWIRSDFSKNFFGLSGDENRSDSLVVVPNRQEMKSLLDQVSRHPAAKKLTSKSKEILQNEIKEVFKKSLANGLDDLKKEQPQEEAGSKKLLFNSGSTREAAEKILEENQ